MGGTFLEALRREALDAPDRLAFRALNSAAGARLLLVACTTERAQIQAIEAALPPGAVARPAQWESYSAAEMVFKTEKGGGLSHQAQRDASGAAALVLCATRPASVRTLEGLFALPA